MEDLKKLRCSKHLGTWYYKKIMPNVYNDYDAPVYELYDYMCKFVITCGSYDKLLMFIKYGEKVWGGMFMIRFMDLRKTFIKADYVTIYVDGDVAYDRIEVNNLSDAFDLYKVALVTYDLEQHQLLISLTSDI